MTTDTGSDLEQLTARLDRLESMIHAELAAIRDDAAARWGRTQLLLQAVRTDVIKLLGNTGERSRRDPVR